MKYFTGLAPNPGELVIRKTYDVAGQFDVEPWYADNEICLQALTFSVPADEWNEFQKSQLYRDIIQYVERCREQYPETPHKHTGCCVVECKEENPLYFGNSSHGDFREWLFSSIRRLFHKR